METIIAFTLGLGTVIFLMMGVYTFKVVGQLREVEEDIKIIFQSLNRFSFEKEQNTEQFTRLLSDSSRELGQEVNELSRNTDTSVSALYQEISEHVSEIYRQIDSRIDKLSSKLLQAPKNIIKD